MDSLGETAAAAAPVTPQTMLVEVVEVAVVEVYLVPGPAPPAPAESTPTASSSSCVKFVLHPPSAASRTWPTPQQEQLEPPSRPLSPWKTPMTLLVKPPRDPTQNRFVPPPHLLPNFPPGSPQALYAAGIAYSPAYAAAYAAGGTHESTKRKATIRETAAIKKDEDGAYENENSAVSKAAKSSREWNGLLREARKARGPQWDWGTAQYHVDEGSEAYYAGIARAKGYIEPKYEAVYIMLANQSDSGPTSPGPTPVATSGRTRRARGG